MDWNKILLTLPKWIFAFLAIVISIVIIYSLTIASCRISLFGLSFGPDRACEETESLNNIPVGTIISSFLPPAVFLKNTVYRNCWLPADGRDTPSDSIYLTEFSKPKLPDLRGMFIRGHNKFDDVRGIRQDKWKDPGERDSDGYQNDQFEKHKHDANMEIGAEPTSGRAKANQAAGAHGRIGTMYTSHNLIVDNSGGNETRPKNIAAYYYIKVR